MKKVELHNCEMLIILPSTEITVKGKCTVTANSVSTSIDGLLKKHFLKDIIGEHDYYYVEAEFDEEKNENKYLLIGNTRCPHGSDIEVIVKVLNKSEQELYDSFHKIRDFLIH
jgi:hypothetical protein